MVSIIDYNVGNVNSVFNSLKRIGIDALITRDIKQIRRSRGIILPGVRKFSCCNGKFA